MIQTVLIMLPDSTGLAIDADSIFERSLFYRARTTTMTAPIAREGRAIARALMDRASARAGVEVIEANGSDGIVAFLESQDDDFQPARIIVVGRITSLPEGSDGAWALRWGSWELHIIDSGPWTGLTAWGSGRVYRLLEIDEFIPNSSAPAGFDPDPDELF